MADQRWQDWVGRSEVQTDLVSEVPPRALAATFDRTDLAGLKAGDALPFVWVWLFFLPLALFADRA